MHARHGVMGRPWQATHLVWVLVVVARLKVLPDRPQVHGGLDDLRTREIMVTQLLEAMRARLAGAVMYASPRSSRDV